MNFISVKKKKIKEVIKKKKSYFHHSTVCEVLGFNFCPIFLCHSSICR